MPSYVYVTTKDEGMRKWLISSLILELKMVQLLVMCKHKERIHMIEEQKVLLYI